MERDLLFGTRRFRLPKSRVESSTACTRYRLDREGVTDGVFRGVMVSIQAEVYA